MTHHHWFRSGSYSLLGHLDLPAELSAHSALVIVPPFGWEDICSYRSLKLLAASLAAEGIAVLRYDLPGTGDSSGSALDSNLYSAWVRSVADAVAELKTLSGLKSVSVMGIRLGAILALEATATETHVENLILWSASASGHALLRELRAFRNMEVLEHDKAETVPPQPVPGLEVAGFLLSPDTERSLQAFDVANFPPLKGQRVLSLSRDTFAQDRRLAQWLQDGGANVTLSSGFGYQAMMAEPHEPSPFEAGTRQIIVDFLKSSPDAQLPELAATGEKICDHQSPRLEGDIVETALSHPYPGGSLFSITTLPAQGNVSPWGILFLNAGGVRHIGPNRMWVEASRRWAAWGIPAVRLDLLRVGESESDEPVSIPSLHSEELAEQFNLIINEMRAKLKCEQFIAVGLCSGAYVAFQTLIRNPLIHSAILLNPRHFFWDPSVDPRRVAKRLGTGLVDVSDWLRLARGEIRPARVQQAARLTLQRLVSRCSWGRGQTLATAHTLKEAWRLVRRYQTRVTLVFADGEPLLEEIEEQKQLPPEDDPLIRCIRVGKVGHTFRGIWSQQMLHELIDREINATLAKSASFELPSRAPERLSLAR